jgi:hypothetical protein
MRGSGSNARGLGSYGRGGSKPSSSQYPLSNVRITKAAPTRPAVKQTVPKAASVKPKTSAKVAERAKPIKPAKAVKPAKSTKPNYIIAIERKASVNERGDITWSKAKKTKMPIGKPASATKPIVKTSPKKKMK